MNSTASFTVKKLHMFSEDKDTFISIDEFMKAGKDIVIRDQQGSITRHLTDEIIDKVKYN